MRKGLKKLLPHILNFLGELVQLVGSQKLAHSGQLPNDTMQGIALNNYTRIAPFWQLNDRKVDRTAQKLDFLFHPYLGFGVKVMNGLLGSTASKKKS